MLCMDFPDDHHHHPAPTFTPPELPKRVHVRAMNTGKATSLSYAQI